MELIKYFLNLYENKKQIALLGFTYLVLALFFVFVAGVCALVNQEFGVKMLYVPLGALGIFFTNIVTWALVRFFVETTAEHNEAKELKLTLKEQKKLAPKKNSK